MVDKNADAPESVTEDTQKPAEPEVAESQDAGGKEPREQSSHDGAARDPLAGKRFKDSARESIIQRQRERRAAERAEREGAGDGENKPGLAKIREYAGQGSVSEPPDVADGATDGESGKGARDGDGPASEGEAPESAKDVTDNVAPNADADTITLKVDGRERTVPVSEVLKAGRAALQKEITVNDRFSELKQQQDALNRAQVELSAWERNLKDGKDRSGLPIQRPEAELPDGGDTKTGASDKGVREALDKSVRALLRGDTEACVEGLTTALTEGTKGRTDSQATLPVEDIAKLAAERLEQSQAERQQRIEAEARATAAEMANEVFSQEYADLEADADMTAIAQQRMAAKMADLPPNKWVEAAREVGDSVRADYRPSSVETPDPAVAQRMSRKLAAPPPTATVTGRVPGPKAPPKRTARDVIAEMKRARGQPA